MHRSTKRTEPLSTRRPSQARPVTARELERAILQMIVDRFGHRPLDLDTALAALKHVAYTLNLNQIDASRR